MNRTWKIFLIAFAFAFAAPARAQQFGNLEKGRAKIMLQNIAKDVKKDYYDPKLHGVDFDGRIREAEARIDKAISLSQAMSSVAWALDILGDSHTFFVPPMRTFRHDYGWRMQMIGDRCFVTQVRPKSDADTKGLKPGDEILTMNGFPPNREIFPTMRYIFYYLRPQPALQLQIRTPEGQQRQLEVAARIRELKLTAMDLTFEHDTTDVDNIIREGENAERLMRTRCVDFAEAQICKVAAFNLEFSQVRSLVGSARKKKALILDLRDNPGGGVDTLEQMVGGFLERDTKIGDRVGRKPLKPLKAKVQGDPFTGKLVVLVDSGSASAAEVFARMMQLEKRATVVGDRSSGLVMEGRFHDYKLGSDNVIFYGALITDADLIMSDGKSLERTGVTPDEVILPTAADLASRRDPAMARAAALIGLKLSAEEAGKLFPFEWKNP